MPYYRIGAYVWNPAQRRRFGLVKCARCGELAAGVCAGCERPLCTEHLRATCRRLAVASCWCEFYRLGLGSVRQVVREDGRIVAGAPIDGG